MENIKDSLSSSPQDSGVKPDHHFFAELNTMGFFGVGRDDQEPELKEGKSSKKTDSKNEITH